MTGILLVAHNGLGSSFVDCARHVLGEVPDNLKVLSVLAEDDPVSKLAEGKELIHQLDKGSGVLILADVFGATPSNIGRQLCHVDHVAGVAGLNLPMLLRVIRQSDQSLAELVAVALDGGRDCIVPMVD